MQINGVQQAGRKELWPIPSQATIQIARSLDKLIGHLIDHSI